MRWIRLKPRWMGEGGNQEATDKLAHVEKLTVELEQRVKRLEADSAVFRRTAENYLRRAG